MDSMISLAKRILRPGVRLMRRSRALVRQNLATSVETGEPQFRRYLSARAGSAEDYLSAACDYVANKTEDETAWLHCKPYERKAGNQAFYSEMYQVMNLLKAMDVTYGGKILEVGSGPGWVTEILVSLGFEVHGLEPCADMIAIARDRVARAISHWQIKDPPPCEFYCQTLEECTLPSDDYDAIFFHAALHHVIDEKAGLAQCFRLLRPGGVLGISEAAWEPGNHLLEAALDEEMARFGTLENPYTREYLDYLLTRSGFTDIQRYHSINGLIPESLGSRSVESLADAPAVTSNNLTAIKQGDPVLTTRNHPADTSAEIRLLAAKITAENTLLDIEIELVNTGKTAWLHRATGKGWVTIAVRSPVLGAKDFRELPRQPLPRTIHPGESIPLTLHYALPADYNKTHWCIDLVNEGTFWFSHCGTEATPLKIP